ncbi:MAG: hypothetical protein WC428_01565 [Candidatus Paceibacterota bacterium]
MKDFELLKRTYPISEFDRPCDGLFFIMENSTPEERMTWGISGRGINAREELQQKIKKGEKYIYQVAKDKGEFKVMCLCFSNYMIIRKYIFKLEDE